MIHCKCGQVFMPQSGQTLCWGCKRKERIEKETDTHPWHGNDDPPPNGTAVTVIISGGHHTAIYVNQHGGELWWYGKKTDLKWSEVTQWRMAW